MSVNEFTLKLRDDYKISPVLSKITPDEWEIILDYVGELLSKHESLSNKFNEDSIKQALSIKYDNQISALQSQTSAYETEIEEIKNRMALLTKAHKKELAQSIKEQRQSIEQQYKTIMEEKYNTLLLTEQSKLSNKDNIIKSLTEQLENLQTTLAQAYNTQLTQLQTKVDAYEVKYNELKLTHQQQLDECATNTKDHIKKQITEEYTDRLNKLQQDLTKQQQHLHAEISNYEKKYDDMRTKYQQQLESKIDNYEKKYEELKNIHQKQLDECVVNTKESIKKQIELQYIDQLSKLQKDIEDREKQFKLQQTKLEKDIEDKYLIQLTAQKQVEEQYQARLKSYETNIAVMSKIDSLDTKLAPMLKHYGGSNNERGTSGENMIYNLLTAENNYLDAVTEDTSGQTARGDIMFSWRKLKCLIEVKNKKAITKDDIDKFTRDIESSIESKYKVNCAIFVSIDTDIIPGRSRDIIQLDFIRNIPVIYIYAPPPCKEIHYAISCLEKVVNTRVSTNEQEKELQLHFKSYYNHIITYQKYFEKALTAKRKEVNALVKHLDIFNDLYEQLTPINLAMTAEDDENPSIERDIENPNPEDTNPDVENPDNITRDVVNHNPDDELDSVSQADKLDKLQVSNRKLTGDSKQKYQQLIDAYIELSLNNPTTTPTVTTLCNYFNVSAGIIVALGGYKKIVSSAKKQFTKTIIPDSKVKMIMDYNRINGAFPSRQILVANKMVSDGSIRKLTKVVKIKKILEYIYEYCRNVRITEVVENEVIPEEIEVKEIEPITEVNTQVEDEPIPEVEESIPEEVVEVKPATPKSSSKKVIKSMSAKIMKKRTLPKKVPIDEPVETEE